MDTSFLSDETLDQLPACPWRDVSKISQQKKGGFARFRNFRAGFVAFTDLEWVGCSIH
jgi:hypothetical protein